MATIKISALPAASGIDGAADYLPIVQAGVTNRINRNTFMGIVSQPLGLTDTQSPTNKTFNNTNSLTVLDTNFTLQDDGDSTKQAKFQLSGITTGTTRTYTLPNASVTLASLTGTETLTNKTITSPAITGGTIDNATITVDSIAGHSTSTIVSIANMQISNGVINSANAVTSTSIAAGAVQPQALQSGTGSGWTWQTFTPTWTNVTVGNAVQNTYYIQIGKTVFVRLSFVLGSTSSITGAVTSNLPVPAATVYGTTPNNTLGSVFLLDNGNSLYQGNAQLDASTTVVKYNTWGGGATYINNGTIAANTTIPFTWGLSDAITGLLIYEAA